jgi:hypothetical protein
MWVCMAGNETLCLCDVGGTRQRKLPVAVVASQEELRQLDINYH